MGIWITNREFGGDRHTNRLLRRYPEVFRFFHLMMERELVDFVKDTNDANYDENDYEEGDSLLAEFIQLYKSRKNLIRSGKISKFLLSPCPVEREYARYLMERVKDE